MLASHTYLGHFLFAECGGWQTGEGGALSSPNYPNMYPSPSRCAWLLEAPVGHTIKVSGLHRLTQTMKGLYIHIQPAVFKTLTLRQASLSPFHI